MTLEEGRKLLTGEGIPFAELHFENERAYWARLLHKRFLYEVYDWNEYHRIER